MAHRGGTARAGGGGRGRARSDRSNRNDDSPQFSPSSSHSASAETDAAISDRSSRAGLGSSARAPSAFHKHRDTLTLHGHVPAFLQSVIASNPALLRQLPPSIANSVQRPGHGSDDEDDDEAAAKRAARERAEWEKRAGEEGEERPVQVDELPVVVNLDAFKGEEAAVSALLGAPVGTDGRTAAAGALSADGGGSGSGGALPVQHVYRKGKHKLAGGDDDLTAKRVKPSAPGAVKQRMPAALSFDAEDM